MDTTTYNQLSCYGNEAIQTPNIDRLAQEGVLFENCFTPVALTQPTHSSLFTGTYPLYHGVRYNLLFQLPQHYKTLAEILKEQGYETAAIVGSYVLEKRFQLDQVLIAMTTNFKKLLL
jgi:choline-sulfatase